MGLGLTDGVRVGLWETVGLQYIDCVSVTERWVSVKVRVKVRVATCDDEAVGEGVSDEEYETLRAGLGLSVGVVEGEWETDLTAVAEHVAVREKVTVSNSEALCVPEQVGEWLADRAGLAVPVRDTVEGEGLAGLADRDTDAVLDCETTRDAVVNEWVGENVGGGV